jgi:hypothetical protein
VTRLLPTLALFAVICAAAAPAGSANDIVEIRLRGHYFAEPANVRMVVAVTPDPQHRRLRIEVDGDTMFRSSEMDLTGEDRRLHTIEFKNLPAGAYTLRAEVLSNDDVVAMAEQELVVAGR